MNKKNPTTDKQHSTGLPRLTPAARLREVEIGIEQGESQRAIARRLDCDEATIRRDITKLDLWDEAREAIANGAPAEPFLRLRKARKAQIAREGRLAEEELDQRHSIALAQEVLDILADHDLFRADEIMIVDQLERRSWAVPTKRIAPRVHAARTKAFSKPGSVPIGCDEMGAAIEYLSAWLLRYILLRAPEHAIRTAAMEKLRKEIATKQRRPAPAPEWGIVKYVTVERRQF